MATTLEEYQIVVAANAESAARGINAFRESLTSFSRALQTCLSPIKEFASAVQDIASASYRMDFSRLANQAERFARSMRKVATASKESGKRETEAAPLDYTRQFAMETTTQEILEMRSGGVAQRLATELGKDNLNEGRVASLVEQYQKLQSKLAEVQAQAQETGKSIGQSLGEAAQNGISKFEKFTSRIGRILSTMLIRTAMRAFMKEFSEVWDAMEKYSKDHGGEFAQTMSMIRGAVSQAAVSLATALAPAMRFVAAAANVATGAIKVLATAINWLLGLLGMSTEFLGMSTEALDGYTNATGGASSGNKDLLASFDELNVIQSSGGGGSPTGGGMDLSSFNEGLSEELAAIEMIIAESMLALGVILTFTGHPGIGIPMMILGLAGVVAETTINWGGLSEEVKGALLKIMIIAGGAMLAIGAIIACASPTHMALGIALMAAGAANIVGAVALAWGSVSGKVKDEIGAILVYVGTALLAIGAILALASPATAPLGIALMAAGGVSLVSAIALNWESLKQSVVGAFNKIKDGIVKAWTLVKEAVGAAWEAVKQWAKAKWSDFQSGWNNIKKSLSTIWSNIGKAISGAWEAVKTWLASKWSDFSRAWDNIKDGFGKVWDNVGTFVSNAWNSVVTWLESRWTNFQTAWTNIREGLKGVWNNVNSAVSNAWVQVKNWIDTKWSNFKQNWQDIKDKFAEKWGEIKNSISDAYVAVKAWLATKWENFKQNWDNIKENLGEKWSEIKSKVTDAYQSVVAWASTKWENFSTNWKNIKEKFVERWGEIKSGVTDAYTSVTAWAATKWQNFKSNWEDVRDNLKAVWTGVGGISGAISSAWGILSAWWDGGANGAVALIEGAWAGVKGWFETNVTTPIAEAFNNAIDTIKGWINTVIGALNSLGKVHIPKVTIPFTNVTLIPEMDVKLWEIPKLPVSTKADGDFNIRDGQLFIANEAGPELVGQMNGHTAVANQLQIIEGIRKGVHDANEDQNALLRQQNELLLGILQKDNGFNGQANIAFGRFAKRSIQLYNDSMGGK